MMIIISMIEMMMVMIIKMILDYSIIKARGCGMQRGPSHFFPTQSMYNFETPWPLCKITSFENDQVNQANLL